MGKAADAEYGPYCCFATDTGNEDSGSVIVEYENGMQVVYSQNFIGVMSGMETSLSPLEDGILSASMCLAAKKSAEQHIFCDIDI